jgi:hypothetical protein
LPLTPRARDRRADNNHNNNREIFMQERQPEWGRDALGERVTDARLEELQQAHPHLDVRYVFRKLRDRYGAVPTLANLLKWLSTETDSRAFRAPAAEQGPKPAPAIRRDPTCSQCFGGGFVFVKRQSGGRETLGLAFRTYTDAQGQRKRQLVRCDHRTRYADPHEGEVVDLEDVRRMVEAENLGGES